MDKKIDLYSQFGLESCATGEEIKKAYRRLALAVHPDKVKTADRQEATTQFQQLSLYYGILSDPQRRKRYDETGSIQHAQELFEKGDDVSWTDFFREMFDTIDQEKIQKFKENYQCKSRDLTD